MGIDDKLRAEIAANRARAASAVDPRAKNAADRARAQRELDQLASDTARAMVSQGVAPTACTRQWGPFGDRPGVRGWAFSDYLLDTEGRLWNAVNDRSFGAGNAYERGVQRFKKRYPFAVLKRLEGRVEVRLGGGTGWTLHQNRLVHGYYVGETEQAYVDAEEYMVRCAAAAAG